GQSGDIRFQTRSGSDRPLYRWKRKGRDQLRARGAKAEAAFLKDAKIKLYASDNHITDFLNCVASRKQPITSEIVGGHSAICCHLLNLAYFHGQKIRWEPKKMEFAGGTGNPQWLTRA